MKKGDPWEKWELEFLQNNYRHVGAVGCQKRLPHRSTGTLSLRAKKLHLKYEYVSKINIDEAVDLYLSGEVDTGELAERYGVTKSGLRHKLKLCGIQIKSSCNGIKRGECWEVPLSRGHVSLVDDSDYHRVEKHKWHLLITEDRKKYAVSSVRKNGVNGVIYLHRFILMAKKGEMVDHRDTKNTLDNRRANLRFADKYQNCWNQKIKKSKSGYKGVSKNGKNGWAAGIGKHKRVYYLGTFPSPREAAVAYNTAARAMFGEYAFLNKV